MGNQPTKSDNELDNTGQLHNAVTIIATSHDYVMIMLIILAVVKILELTIFFYRQFVNSMKEKYRSNDQNAV